MASSAAEWSWMAVVASEELQRLEALHPGRFDSLKADLRLLVTQPMLDVVPGLLLLPRHSASLTASASSFAAPARSAASQVSSNRWKRKSNEHQLEEHEEEEVRGRNGSRREKKSDRVEIAIERAERCLKRIRTVKQSLFGSATN